MRALANKAPADIQSIVRGSPRVLIVEDTDDDVLLAKHALDVLGIRQFHAVKSAEAAIKVLDRKAFQVALIDYDLPGMNGLELLQVLRVKAPEMRIILVSEARDAQVALTARKLGVVDYVSKDDFLTYGVVRSVQDALREIQSVTDLLEATEMNLWLSCEEIARKAASDKEKLFEILVERRLSPRDIMEVWRDALRSCEEASALNFETSPGRTAQTAAPMVSPHDAIGFFRDTRGQPLETADAQESPLKVLMVEDSEDDVHVVQQLIEISRLPVELNVAPDSDSAIDYLRAVAETPEAFEVPRVVLLDLSLPESGGIEVLRNMRGDPQLKHIPVIVLSDAESEDDLLRSQALKVHPHIVKPMSLYEFTWIARSVWGYWPRVDKLRLD